MVSSCFVDTIRNEWRQCRNTRAHAPREESGQRVPGEEWEISSFACIWMVDGQRTVVLMTKNFSDAYWIEQNEMKWIFAFTLNLSQLSEIRKRSTVECVAIMGQHTCCRLSFSIARRTAAQFQFESTDYYQLNSTILSENIMHALASSLPRKCGPCSVFVFSVCECVRVTVAAWASNRFSLLLMLRQCG